MKGVFLKLEDKLWVLLTLCFEKYVYWINIQQTLLTEFLFSLCTQASIRFQKNNWRKQPNIVDDFPEFIESTLSNGDVWSSRWWWWRYRDGQKFGKEISKSQVRFFMSIYASVFIILYSVRLLAKTNLKTQNTYFGDSISEGVMRVARVKNFSYNFLQSFLQRTHLCLIGTRHVKYWK